MPECFEISCRHYAFRGRTAFCEKCDIYKAKPTGRTCAKCGNPVMVRRNEPQLLQYLCVPCSIEARKHDFGLATDANIHFCYYIATGKVVSWDLVKSVLEKTLSSLNPEELGFYKKAKDGFHRMSGRHSAMGGVWRKLEDTE